MSPTGNFVNGAVSVKMPKAGILVRLQGTLEILQMPAWMFTLAIFRVSEPHRWGG
jgi:hypothetical protein